MLQVSERELCLRRELPGVSDDFCPFEEKEPVVGHHEGLLLFGKYRVCDVLPLDGLGVWVLPDVGFDLFGREGDPF